MLDTWEFRAILEKGKALNLLRLKASEMAPPVGLEPTTHTVRNIVALLGALAMLVVSSCSEHRFICRRQRGALSLDTLRVQYSKHLILTKSEIVRFAHGEIICSANCDICRFASSEMK